MKKVALAVVLSSAVLSAGCMAGASSAVQRKAAQEFMCGEQKVTVTKVADARRQGLYRAEGCGRHEVYLCDGWDSMQQEPVCTPDPDAK